MFATIKNDRTIRLSSAERSAILLKMPITAKGEIYADAVFQGAGIKGIALLGALRCCNDVGITWQKVAGTSAGAITAAFVAANLSMDELEHIWGEYDYMRFLSQKSHPWIFTGDPADDLMFPLPTFLALFITGKLGLYSSEPFKVWLEGCLSKLDLKTFTDLKKNHAERELKVVVSDISNGEMLVLPDDLGRLKNRSLHSLLDDLKISNPDDFNIAEAVRLSMSIPLFFEPGKLGNDLIVDGGISSNFPLWIYDAPVNRTPEWPTFGFQIIDKNTMGKGELNSPLKLLQGMVATAMGSRDRYQLRQSDQGRIIDIDVTEAKVSSIDFKISPEKRQFLYRIGYEQTKQFFLNYWNWEQHLALRGFGKDKDKDKDKDQEKIA